MKRIFFLFSLLLSLTNLRAENTNENVGAWSEAVNGLRGRLIVTLEKEENGVQSPKVFLELQNVGNILDSIRINAFDPKTSFQCRVVDGTGKPMASDLGGIREMVVPAFTLSIPFESSLRLNVNRHFPGAFFWRQSLPKKCTEIVLGCDVWAIDKEDHADYLLEGTFHIEESKPVWPPNWSGTLKIPGVKISRD
jgi:hypothetical protein